MSSRPIRSWSGNSRGQFDAAFEEERMKVLKVGPFALCLALASLAPIANVLAADPTTVDASTEPERFARWKAIAEQIFGDRKIEPTETLIKLDAPRSEERRVG